MDNRNVITAAIATILVGCAGGTPADQGGYDARDAGHTTPSHDDSGASGMDGGLFLLSDAGEASASDSTTPPPAADASHGMDAAVDAPTTLDLHEAIIYDNPSNLADWPVTTTITEVDFQYMGSDGVHVEFSKEDDAGGWPDVTPPGWTGSLQYTLGFAEYIGGQWYASAAIQFWRGLAAEGGNVAADTVTAAQCTAFGFASSCQVAKNWYYDGRWGELAGYQPATGETIGVFVVAGNVRGVTDGSESPVQERSNVVLVPMPDIGGATYTF
jgi:hypothetical protein